MKGIQLSWITSVKHGSSWIKRKFSKIVQRKRMKALAGRQGSLPDCTGWASCPRSAGRGLRTGGCWPGLGLGLPGPPGPGNVWPGFCQWATWLIMNQLDLMHWKNHAMPKTLGTSRDLAPNMVREAVPTARSAFLGSLYWCLLQFEGNRSLTVVKKRGLLWGVCRAVV